MTAQPVQQVDRAMEAIQAWDNHLYGLNGVVDGMTYTLLPIVESLSRGGTRTVSTGQVAAALGCPAQELIGSALRAIAEHGGLLEMVVDDSREPRKAATAHWRLDPFVVAELQRSRKAQQ